MSALLRKEIRSLLPGFSVAFLLTFSLWLVPIHPESAPNWQQLLFVFPFAFCPAAVVAMALGSFGGEIGAKTFANLLSQPISRSRIWWTKTIPLAGAMLLVFCAWWSQLLLHSPTDSVASYHNLDNILVTSALLGLTAFSGALWTVLLLRQIGAAFWITVLVPAALAMFTHYLTERFSDTVFSERNIIIVLALYSVGGFLWARRLFLRGQDIQWTGGTIALPSWFKMPLRLSPARSVQGRRPRLALFLKEVQLHQSQFVIAGVLVLLHLGIIVARKAGGGFKNSYVLEFLVFQFWILWVLLPLLIGCTAVAEERRLGTLEAQLCLPARRRTQFLTKAVVALVLAILFGVVMPLLFEGARILPNLHESRNATLDQNNPFLPRGVFVLTLIEIAKQLDPLLPFLPLTVIAVGFVTMAFYASTLARNTLQAIAPAILGIVLTWALLACANPQFVYDFFGYPLWRGYLIYLISVPTLIVTIASLTYWNFKRVFVGWPVWRRNVLVLLSSLALVVAATTAIYNRAWEFFAREPAHGPSQITRSEIKEFNAGPRGIIILVLADGRAWSTPFTVSVPSWPSLLLGNWRIAQMGGGGHFLPGTNWLTFAHCWQDVIGLQKDGTLWVSEQPAGPWKAWRRGQPRESESSKLVRLGNDSNWKSLAARWTEAYLVKTDGTLWRVGPSRFDGKKKWPGLRAFPPQRLGDDADWDSIEISDHQLIFCKRDGRAYVSNVHVRATDAVESIKLDVNLTVTRTDQFAKYRWRKLVWAQSPRRGGFQVGLDENGSLEVSGFPVYSRFGPVEQQNIQLGRGTNWVALAGSDQTVVSLKADGSLWKWDFPHDLYTTAKAASAKRFGTHSDWQGIAGGAGGMFSLAADGDLWFWHFESSGYYDEFQPLLAPTRRPQRIVNIFGKTD